MHFYVGKVFDLPSTEGCAVNQYKNNYGDIFRYSIYQYGEMGKVEYEYYKIDKDVIYVTVLESIYSCLIYVGTDVDILKSDFNEYVIINGEIYYLDNYDEKLIDIKQNDDDLPFTDFKEMDTKFIETNE